MNTFARSGAAALAAALTFTLAACGGTTSTATSTSPGRIDPASRGIGHQRLPDDDQPHDVRAGIGDGVRRRRPAPTTTPRTSHSPSR